MAESVRAEAWSDFDGTAVEKLKKTNWRNWTKYPIPGIPGYSDFLRGVRSTGVDVAGVVSRRPDLFPLPRRFATARSVSKLGLNEFFAKRQLVHAGSERAKARFVVARSLVAHIGLIEDKPHAVGIEIVKALVETTKGQDRSAPRRNITLGVVNHPQAASYISRLSHQVDQETLVGTVVSEHEDIHDGVIELKLANKAFQLSVVRLEPYSVEAGEAFGAQLLEPTS